MTACTSNTRGPHDEDIGNVAVVLFQSCLKNRKVRLVKQPRCALWPSKTVAMLKNIGAGEVCFTNRYKPRILILQVLQGRLWVGNLQGKKTQKERLGTCWNLSEVFFSELVIPWCICSEIGSEYGMTYLKWSLNIWVPWVPSHFRPFGPLEAP